MRRGRLDRAILLVVLIVLVIGATVAVIAVSLRGDELTDLIAANGRVSILITTLTDDGRLSTQAFYYQPLTNRGALFDVPAATGVVVAAVNRVDSIDTALFAGDIAAYRMEVGRLLGEPIPYHLHLTEAGLELLVDLVEGVPLFLADLPDVGPEAVLLPSGDVILDGAKAVVYARYAAEGERDRDRAARHQKLVTALLARIGQRSQLLSDRATLRLLLSRVETNMTAAGIAALASELGSMTVDRMISRQVEGAVRRVPTGDQEKALLFPHQETRWLKESVRQVVANLESEESIHDENIVIRLEILNGTTIVGLASRTAEIYRSYGFDVVAVGNAPTSDVEQTVVIDRRGNEVFLRRTADVIRARRTESRPDELAAVDITVILGANFDGRYVR